MVNLKLRRIVLTQGVKVLGLSVTLKALRACAGLSLPPHRAAPIFVTQTGGIFVTEMSAVLCQCLNGQQEAELLLQP